MRTAGILFAALLLALTWAQATNLEDIALASGWEVRVHASDVTTSEQFGAQGVAANRTSGDVFSLSFDPPSGFNIQVARIDSTGAITRRNFSSLQISGGSGLEFDPVTGGVITADDANNRVVVVNPDTGSVQNLVSLPFNINPNSNGSGQQHFAVNSNDPNLLYFWDNTKARVFELNRSTQALRSLLALDQGTSDGNHFATGGNDLAFDPHTNKLLLTDNLSRSLLEIDPVSLSVNALLSGTNPIRGVELTPDGNRVFVLEGGELKSVSRSGGALSFVASGVNFSHVTLGKASQGDGFSIFASEASSDTIFEFTQVVPEPGSFGLVLLGIIGLAIFYCNYQNGCATL